jgi:hypothetical protein
MLTRLTLALTVSLLLSAQASAQERKQPPTAPPHKLNVTTSWVPPFEGATFERRA